MVRSASMVISLQGTNNRIWISTNSDACLSRKNPGTIEVYQRMPRDFLLWLTGSSGHTLFRLDQLTGTTVKMYMRSLEDASSSMSHWMGVKSILSSFCHWLIDEHGLLKHNPARLLELPVVPLLALRILLVGPNSLRISALLSSPFSMTSEVRLGVPPEPVDQFKVYSYSCKQGWQPPVQAFANGDPIIDPKQPYITPLPHLDHPPPPLITDVTDA